MKRALCHFVILSGIICILTGPDVWGRSRFDPEPPEARLESSSNQADWTAVDLRHVGVHDAGVFYVPLSDGFISSGLATHRIDPETGETIGPVAYPQGSGDGYIFAGAIWVGGIVGNDTLVTVARDGWFTQIEFRPEYPDSGGMRRTGHFADDEFATRLVDSASADYPLDIEVTLSSYSWADTVYDDFVILDYVLSNVGGNFIEGGWAGFYFDYDVYHLSNLANGWMDDFSGALDTLLYADDSSSRVLIAYGCDNDGDPVENLQWHDESVPAVVGITLLDCSFPVAEINFNWWISNSNIELDYGPRRVGTPEDPLRLFSNGNLGTPVDDNDKYYLMSHPEVDFFQAETAAHDSGDGWIVPAESRALDIADGADTRFFYSFGSFDLTPGDSVRFVLALVAAPDFHTDPAGYADNYDPLDPAAYENGLNVSELMRHLRRADSVYRSGYYLPVPGPPAGLRVTEYDDAYVELTWAPSNRGDLAGYRVYLKDTLLSDVWRRITPAAFTDTTLRIPLFEPTHAYLLAVSLVDTLGRESDISIPVTVIPGMPHPPESLSVSLDGAIPVLQWRPSVDTALQAYMIYRSIWRDTFMLHDSTAALTCRDYRAESGVEYGYRVSSVNDLGFESDLSDPAFALPMAMDRSVLFCNLNRYETQSGKLYPQKYIERLYETIASLTPVDRVDADDSAASLETMSHYPVVVFEAGNLPAAFWIAESSVRFYLREGGRAVFAAPSLGRTGVPMQIIRYGPGSLYHDYLRLDSSVFPGVVISGSSFVGDLTGCESLHPDYPPMTADPFKLTESDIPIIGDIPVSGYLFPKDEVEPLYRYISSNPDTISHGQINGYRHITDEFGVVVLNFPLAAMQEWDNIRALRQALTDLGVNLNCGDINDDGRIGFEDILILINYLYREGPPPVDFWRADAACDQDLNLQDIMTLINYIFRGGWLDCCRQGAEF